jgi:hypothetical protein
VQSELVEVNGARGVHVWFSALAPAGALRFDAYTFYQQNRTHNVVFVGRADRATEFAEVRKRALSTMRAPRGDLRLFGKPRWMRDLHWHAMRFVPLMILGLLAIPAIWLWERRKRARRRSE